MVRATGATAKDRRLASHRLRRAAGSARHLMISLRHAPGRGLARGKPPAVALTPPG